ncbi:MAG: FAD-dependent thymidylate synthase [Synergistaceae bacterium]|jgi:thymidylate synthase (FAD)|nr:FAD-dependent thymidylate synthase [Synergistaceae bacterium]
MSCEVHLAAYTPEPSRVVASAAKLCYSASSATDLFSGLDETKTGEFLRKLASVGHFSPFEHASFTFAVDGLSRVASHQLVRHRVASFSQQSQRYVVMGAPKAVIPPEVARIPEAAAIFSEQVRSAHRTYGRLVELGVPKEDARFILPHGWETSLMITMNARELRHFFALRLCRRAQWEIRDLARKMLTLVREAALELFDPAGPTCLTDGRCREAQSCGRPFASVEELTERQNTD